MKCQLTLKSLVRNTLLGVLVVTACAATNMSAVVDTIDEMQEYIRQNSVTPDAIVAYEKHARRFESLLADFLNQSNKMSVDAHIARIKIALDEFQKEMVSNERYSSVRLATEHLHVRFSKLLRVIQENKKSNPMLFLLNLKPFLDCVPKSLKNKYDSGSLVVAVRNRLQCS